MSDLDAEIAAAQQSRGVGLASAAILVRGSSARQPRSSGNRGPEMVFGDTEERLSQFGNKRQILNAIREHYLMKREADHGSQLFWDRIFLD